MDGFRKQMSDFGFGDVFFDEYYIPRLEELNKSPLPSTISSLADLKNHSAWLGGIGNYIASTITRGEAIVSSCFERSSTICRALDVGCGFGGTLVALGRRGVEAKGIELDDDRVRASRTLLRDRGVPGEVVSMNIYDKNFSELDPFDLIITENVIEHVEDPNLFIETLSPKISKNGILYMEFPNMHSISGAVSESHFGLPLVTLLPRLQAMNAVRSRFGEQAGYDVGEYHPLSFYTNKLQNVGLQIMTVTPHEMACRTLSEFDSLLAEVIRLASNLQALYPHIAQHERHFLHDRVWAFIAKAAQARSSYVSNNELDPINGFLADSFVIYARRPG